MIKITSQDPMDYVKIALAIETLAYYNLDYLNYSLSESSCERSEQIQWLLLKALERNK